MTNEKTNCGLSFVIRNSLMAGFAGLQVLHVMTAVIAKLNVRGFLDFGFVFRRNRVLDMALGAFGNIFAVMRHIPVRS